MDDYKGFAKIWPFNLSWVIYVNDLEAQRLERIGKRAKLVNGKWLEWDEEREMYITLDEKVDFDDRFLSISAIGLIRAVEQLPPINKEHILLHFRDKKSYLQISLMKDCSKERVRQRIRDAIQDLRKPKIRELYELVPADQFRALQSDFAKAQYEFDQILTKLKISKEDIPDILKQTNILDTSLEELDLSVRARNCFTRANIKTLGGIANMTRHEVLHLRNMGVKTLEEIEFKLQAYGLGFREEES